MSKDKNDKNKWSFMTDVTELQESLTFWNDTAKKHEEESIYYQRELQKAHELLGRVIHQVSERWDSVNLTKYFPTDNPHHDRSINNPSGRRD